MRDRAVLGKVVRAGATAASIVVLVGVPLAHTAPRQPVAAKASAAAPTAQAPQAKPIEAAPAAERRRSRTEYAGLSRAGASALLRETFPGAATSPVFDATADGLGGRVVRRIDRSRAVVELEGGRRSLVQSAVPLTVATAGGGRAAVDQSLERRGDDFAPVQPLVPTEIGGTAAEGVSFAGVDVTVAPGTPNDAAGSIANDRAFYAGVATDTDYMVTPTPGGIETFFQLRSAASPQRLMLDFDLPAGARFITARTDKPIPGDPPRALEIVDGDKTLGYVYPPLTMDADGRLVPSRFEPRGGDVEITVDHRDGAFRYPLLVDPEVVVTGCYCDIGWPGWRHVHRVANYNPPYSHIGAQINNPAYAPGLYLSLPTNNTFKAGDWGSFFYQPQRETFLYQAQFGNVSHQPYYSYALHGFGTTSLDANWWASNTYHCNQWGGCAGFVSATTDAYSGVINTFCYTNEPRCTAQGTYFGGVQFNNTAQWAIQAPWDVFMGNNRAHIAMGWANVWIGDWEAPRLTSTPGNRDWYRDGPAGTPHSIAPVLTDDGVGPYAVSFGGAASGTGTQYYGCVAVTSGCSGSWGPGWTYTLNEGHNSLSLSGSDVIGHGTSYGWYERIDRTPPTFTITGAVRPEAQLAGGVPTLSVNANDVGAGGAQNSGVKQIQATWNGITQTKFVNCGSGPCNTAFAIDAQSVEGRLPVTVRAVDGVGLDSSQTFYVVVDRSDPEIARLSDRVYDNPFLGAGTFPLRVDAKDFGGTGAGTNTVRNSSFESGLPGGTFGNGGSVAAGTYLIPFHGTRAARLQATTNGTMGMGNDSSRLAVAPGDKVTLSAYVWTQPGREARVVGRLYNGSGAFVAAQDAGGAGGNGSEWRRVQGTLTVPAGAASVGWEIRFPGVATGEVAYVDAVQVERGDFAFGYSPHRDEVPQFERSGVTGMELLVGGTSRASMTWTCPGHSCARSHTLSLATAPFAEGRHSASVRVSDGVGRSTQSQPWDVVVDRSAPRITRLAGALRQAFVGSGTYGLLLEATDQGDDAPVANLIPSSSFERRTPGGLQAADATVAAEATTAADGARALKVTASGGAPRVFSDANRIPVDPGERLTLAASARSDAAGAQFAVAARWFDGAGQPIAATPTSVPLTAAWTRRSEIVTAPANAATLGWQVAFTGLASGAIAYLDAVQLERNATVAAYTPSPDELAASLQRSGVTMTGVDIAQVGGSGLRELRSTWTCPSGSCPRSDRLRENTAGLPEGRQRLTARAADQAGNTVAGDSWETIVDLTGPQVTMTGTRVPGTAGGQAYEARVEATDGSTASPQAERSGVVRVEFLVRDDTVPGAPFISRDVQTQDCPNGSCGRTATFRLDDLTRTSTIRAVVTDQVGHQTVREVQATADSTPPEVALSGRLIDAIGMTLTEGAYDLLVRAGDPLSGMGSIEILLRRSGDVLFTRQDYREQACPNGGCSLTRRWVFRPQAYAPGDYTVRVIARDMAGNATTRDVPVKVGTGYPGGDHSLGLEEFWNYDTVQTGAGTAAHVDTGTGNFVWHSTPVVNPGRGLSSVLNLTYNSQEESTTNVPTGYDEAGRGFSIGISGLTRLNEPLDLTAVAWGGEIVLTDVDGTRHVFRAGADGPDLDTEPDYWIPPAGVQLHLRRWSVGDPAIDPWRAYAATRPDGVTFFFDSNGYASSIVDRNGNELSFYYQYGHDGTWSCPYWDSSSGVPAPEEAGTTCIYKLAGVNSPGGNGWALYYADGGSGWPETGPLQWLYDNAGRLTTFTYDENGNLATLTQASGEPVQREFRFHYEQPSSQDARPWLTGVTDPRGNTTSIQYQTASSAGPDWRYGRRVLRVTNRRNQARQYAYALDNGSTTGRNITFVTDARGNQSTVRSDLSGRPRRLTDAAGTNTRLEFDADNNVTTMVEAEGAPEEAVSQMSYNQLGLLTTQVDAEGRRTQLDYVEGTGSPSLVSPRGTDDGHEFVADLVSMTEPRGFVQNANPADHTWRYTVDTQTGNVTERYAPGVTTPARTTFGPHGEITSETSEVGDRIEYPIEHYDFNGMPKVQIGPFRPNAPAPTDGKWFFRYDTVGNLTRVTDPRGTTTGGPNDEKTQYTTRYVYDALDRMTEARTPVDSTASTPRFSTERWSYDANDNTKVYTDARGAQWTWDYTPMDRQEIARTPAVPHFGVTGNTTEDTRYTYDPEDNVSKIEMPEGVRTSTVDDFTTSFAYDVLNRPVVQTRHSRGGSDGPVDLVTSYAYDRRDNLVAVVDPKRNSDFGGNPAQNALDPARRRFSYEYDRVDNQIASIAHPGGQPLRTTIGFDADDNRTSVTTARGFTTRWEYDARGFRIAQVDGVGNRTEWHPRADGRLDEVVAPKGVATPDVADDYETRFDYYPTGHLRSQSLPRDDRQYGPQFLRVFWHRNSVGDPICITDARARAGGPDDDCNSRFSFENEFLDTGQLESTERPSWWELGTAGLVERDPQAVGNRGGSPAMPSSGNGEGDFGSVEQLPLPALMPFAGRTTFKYDDALELTEVTDVIGKKRQIIRDATSRIVEVSWPFDEEERIQHQQAYDHNGNQRRFENGRHQVTITTFDQFDRALTQDAPGKNDQTREITSFGYDRNGLRTRLTTPKGHIWEWGYDSLDRLSFSEDALDNRTVNTYDADGNLQTERTPKGHVTRYEYDGAGRLEKTIDPHGEETRRGYDANGNLVRVDAPGSRPAAGEDYRRQITTWTYEGRDLPWTMTKGPLTTAWEYDGGGNLRRSIEPTGINSDTGRPRWEDNAPILTDPTDADDRENEDVRLATKYATLREYSADNVLQSIHLAWGDADLDDNGQTSTQDERRFRQDFVLNTRGWPQSIDSPYEWTLSVQQQTENGTRPARTSYQYFDTGWIERATEPSFVKPGSDDPVGGHMTSYEYYKSGDQRIWRAGPEDNPRREMRRTLAPNGVLMERIAEKAGDPSPRRYTYDYDANQNMEEMIDVRPGDTPDRVTWLRYDANDRIKSVNERWENGKDTELTYDADGHISQRRTDGALRTPTPDDDRTYTGGTRTRFTYDARGAEQTAIVTRAGERARTVLSDWFPSGQRARRIRCNGELDPADHPDAACGDEGTDTSLRATDHYFYRSDGRVISKVRDPREGPSDTQEYTYDDNGNRNRDERGTHTFNARNQLTSWTKAGRGTVRYEVNGTGAVTEKVDRGVRTKYDYVGDRMVASHMTEAGTTVDVHYCHSDFGNVVRITREADSCEDPADPQDTTYTYDEFERMTESKEQGQTPTTYAYDAIDRRDYKSRNGSRTDYGYIGLSEDLSRETRGDTFRAYDYDASGERFGYTSRDGGGALSYRSYALDASGSVTGLEGDGGVVADNEKYEYDPYGEMIKGNGDLGEPACGAGGMSDQACEQPFRFQGFYYDSGIKTYDMQARAYRPDIGRFLTSDRYESSAGDFNLQADPLTQNRYAFAGGNPVNRVEFDGHGFPPEPGDPNPGKTIRELNKDRFEGQLKHQREQEAAEQAAKQKGPSDEQIQVASAIQNAVQAAAEGDDKRFAANMAVLLKLRQEQLNRAAMEAGQQAADAEANAPESMTWQDVAKIFFDPSDPLDWAALGGGFLFKAAKTALKLRKAKKLYDTINKARKLVDAAKDRVAGLKFAAGRNADLAGQLTACAYPGNSFVAGTPILMADGTLRPIEKVFKGDLVLATDPKTGATVARPVTALIRGDGRKDMAVVWVGGQRLIATDEHPLFTVERGWVEAADLRRGEHLLDADGTPVAVDAVLDLAKVTWVYNITVAGLHTYYVGADPMLAHNASPKKNNPACPSTKRSSNMTASGVPRENPKEWKRLQNLWDSIGLDDILSAANREKIANRLTPIVDEDWVRHFPGDFTLMGEKISMHHINRSPLTVPLPRTRHLKDAHMPGGTGRNPGGPGMTG
jgi:RHS repeat-associated protein